MALILLWWGDGFFGLEFDKKNQETGVRFFLAVMRAFLKGVREKSCVF
jgi:hypothetical protein